MKGANLGLSGSHPRPRLSGAAPAPAPCNLLQDLLASSIVLVEDWLALPETVREGLERCPDPDALLARLVGDGLLTEYQAGRVLAGTTFGLTLGNYRILDRIGAGGMGIVFLAEHLCMRRRVAIKVLPLGPQEDGRLLTRFFVEMRAVARLQHPNIVAALDAGQVTDPASGATTLHFFVMEYVPGLDLEEYVKQHGPLSPARAADVIHQVASALAEANKQNLVHRDIKPSNIILTPEGQAKLLDFGLTRQHSNRLTEPGTLLGTLDYMAPEQVQDASAVDIRADLYALGGVLFWCLTGQTPFPRKDGVAEMLACRLLQQPRSVRSFRPDVPAELDAVVARLMAAKPADRYQTPQAVMQALVRFLTPAPAEPAPAAGEANSPNGPAPAGGQADGRVYRVLLVDDEVAFRTFCRHALATREIECAEAADGTQALEAARTGAYDLLLLDMHMPGLGGAEVCRRLREAPPQPHLKVILISGAATSMELTQGLLASADDCLPKPISAPQLLARVKAALKLKDAQDRCARLQAAGRDSVASAGPDGALADARKALTEARAALVLALTRMVEQRGGETRGHLRRLQRYSRRLAEQAARAPELAGQVDEAFLEALEWAVPLHDIGKVGLPDHILLKPGKFDADERFMMQSHTTLGAETLAEVGERHGFDPVFLRLATEIARHHHERFDGEGYPDRLAGSDIPLGARVAAVADTYDALRSRRPYRPALSHMTAAQIVGATLGQFDPVLVRAFRECAADFERIFRETPD